MGIPQSTIHVCSGVRLNSRYEHSIYFADRAEQLKYFAGKVVKTFSAYSFIRKTWDLNVAATMEDAESWSYLYFTNTANGRRYFYFIDNIEYVNDGTVRLKLQIDVLQTYLFDDDVEFLECFVEREHTSTDSPVSYTVDEGLETGELIDNDVFHWGQLNNKCILVLATINPNHADTEEPVQALSGSYNGVFSGLKVWAVDGAKADAWGKQLDALATKGFLDGIVSMWMYPRDMVDLGGENNWGDEDLCKTVDGAKSAGAFLPFDEPPTTVDGYTPKNKKLLTYPYSFLYVSNNCGGSAVYRWERFGVYKNPQFTTVGTISPEGVVKMYPTFYNGIKDHYDQGLSIGGFPTCAWDSDVYKIWLAQNQNQQQFATDSAVLTMAGGAISAVAGLATGNMMAVGAGATAIVSGGRQIEGMLAQQADMRIQPPQAKGGFSSNVNITAGKHTFSFYKKSVSAERAKIIDDYFTMYGYKVNRVKTPSIYNRKSHTYVKTIGCHIKANLCNEDATKIESIFDNGVTFWTDGDRIGQYSDDNSTLV